LDALDSGWEDRLELFSVEVLFDGGELFDGELGGLGTGDGLGIGVLHGMEFVCR